VHAQVLERKALAKGDARRDRPDENGPKYQAKRDQILDTAVAAFRLKGYAGTSTQDIARALQMTKGSLYYYFRDKEDILFSCHERALDHLLSGARAARNRDPEAALRELIERHVGIMVHEFRGTALALEVATLNGSRHDHIVRRRDQYEGILRDLIEKGVRSGAFRPVDSRLASFAFLGAINWMARWYREGGGRSAEEIGRTFADLFVRSLQRPRVRARVGLPSVQPPGRRARAPSRRKTRGGPP
jgi:AcrR family transcriptional regulator